MDKKLKKKFIFVKRKKKIMDKNDKLEKLKEDLHFIDEQVKFNLEEDKLSFVITDRQNKYLAHKLFNNIEQYTFGDEPYHYYFVNINKKGLNKLHKMINKVNRDIKKNDFKIKKNGWWEE